MGIGDAAGAKSFLVYRGPLYSGWFGTPRGMGTDPAKQGNLAQPLRTGPPTPSLRRPGRGVHRRRVALVSGPGH